MDDATTGGRPPSILPSMLGVTLAALASITLIAAMSGFRAEAAPEPEPETTVH